MGGFSKDYLIELQEIILADMPNELYIKYLKRERKQLVSDPVWDEYDKIFHLPRPITCFH